jgi:hypothetical protein
MKNTNKVDMDKVNEKIFDAKFYGYGLAIATVILAIVFLVTNMVYWLSLMVGCIILSIMSFIKVVYIKYIYKEEFDRIAREKRIKEIIQIVLNDNEVAAISDKYNLNITTNVMAETVNSKLNKEQYRQLTERAMRKLRKSEYAEEIVHMFLQIQHQI